MTTLELNAKKAELIKAILNDIDSEEILNQIADVLQRLTLKKLPCTYSPEELQARTNSVIKGYKEGRGVSQEDMRKRHSA